MSTLSLIDEQTSERNHSWVSGYGFRFLFVGLTLACVWWKGTLFGSTTAEAVSTVGTSSLHANADILVLPDRPIVGILSLSASGGCHAQLELPVADDFVSCGVIPSTYVRWLQSAGAQVVAVPHYWNEEKLLSLVNKLSGILFTGGDFGDTNWNTTTTLVYEEVIRRNNTDRPLALLGICLGFERVLQIASKDDVNTVVEVELIDESIPIEWTPSVSSPFFNFMGHDTLNLFSSLPIAYNFHSYGVTPESWHEHANELDSLFNVLGLFHNPEDQDKPFIGMFEGKDGLPIWGVQFHPEKALFEWSTSLRQYPVSTEGVYANRKIADFFVNVVNNFQNSNSLGGFTSIPEVSEFAVGNYRARLLPSDEAKGIYREAYVIIDN